MRVQACCVERGREVERSRGREVERSRGREVERERSRGVVAQTHTHTHLDHGVLEKEEHGVSADVFCRVILGVVEINSKHNCKTTAKRVHLGVQGQIGR